MALIFYQMASTRWTSPLLKVLLCFLLAGGPASLAFGQQGMDCSDPIPVFGLPFNDVDQRTADMGDDYGSSPCDSVFVQGNEILYRFTPSADMLVDLRLEGITDTNTAVQVLEACPDVASACVADSSNDGTITDISIPALALDSGTRYFIVIATNGAPDTTRFDLRLDERTCEEPIGVEALNVTDTTAGVEWTSGGANTWNLLWGPSGFEPDSGKGTMAKGVSSKPYTLTGLSPSTDYDVYVQDSCPELGTSSDWSFPATFTTDCGTIVPPYKKDFETDTPSLDATGFDCFNNEPANTTTEYRWLLHAGATNSLETGPLVDHSKGTTNGVYIYTEATNGSAGDVTTVTTPLVDLKGLDEPILDFWYHMAGDAIGTLHIDLSTDSGQTWTEDVHEPLVGAQQDGPSDSWQRTVAHLDSFSAQVVQLRFRAVSDGPSSGDIAVDDIRIVDTPDCLFPVDLEVVSIGTDRIRIAWQPGNGTSWDIEYGPKGFEPGNGTLIQGVGQNPYAITGLISSTVYDVYVRDNCTDAGNGVSVRSGPLRVRTACAKSLAPMTKDFEELRAGSDATGYICWEAVPANSNSDYRWNINNGETMSDQTGPAKDHTKGTDSGRYVYTEASSGFAGDSAVLISQPIDVSQLDRPRLDFWYHMFGAEVGALRLDISTDTGKTWTTDIMTPLTKEAQEEASDAWKKQVVDLAPYDSTGILLLRFKGVRGTGYLGDIALDDIRIRETPTLDAAPADLLKPVGNDCYTAAEELEVALVNLGAAPLDLSADPVTIRVGVSGANTDTLVHTLDDNSINGGDPIPVQDTVRVTMPEYLNMTTYGSYFFDVSVELGGDGDTVNDVLEQRTVVTGPPNTGTPAEDTVQHCLGSTSTVELVGTFGSIRWQKWDGEEWQSQYGPGSATPEFPVSPQDSTLYRAAVCDRISDTIRVEVIEVPKPRTENDTVCPYEEATPRASGGGFYQWFAREQGGDRIGTGDSLAITVAPPDSTLYVERRDSTGCWSLREPATAVVETPTAQPLAVNDSVCPGDSAELSVLGGGPYEWYDRPVWGTRVGTGPTRIVPDLTADSTFYVQRKEGGCLSLRTPVTAYAICPTGLQDPTLPETDLSLYPNPVQDRLNASLNAVRKGELRWELIDVLGNRVMSGVEKHASRSPGFVMDVSTLPSGLYFLRVRAPSGRVQEPFVKGGR